jgi:hypothetical protein
MKKNVLISILAGATALTLTTGCLEQKPEEEPSQNISHRDALIAALDNQAVSLVDSINKVIISGDFVANLPLNNPPKPIPVEGDDDVKKAIGYLFANEVVNGDQSSYTPDSRICSEIIAKDHPATCEKVFEKVSFLQQISDEDTGYVQLKIDGVNALGLAYDSSLISFNVNAADLFAALEKVDAIQVAAGEESFTQGFPSTRNGAVTLTVANQMGASIVDLTIAQAISVAGVTPEGQNYSLSIPAANNAATVSLIPSLGIGTVSLNVPAISAQFPVEDHLNAKHALAISFPGLTGQLSLNNALSLIDVAALNLNSAIVSATVDGQAAIQVNVQGPLNAQVHADAGDINVQFSSPFAATLQAVSNALFSESGSVSASIAQDTNLLFAKDADQAKVLNGSFSLIGSGDFTANMDAQAGMCIEGQDEPFYLQTAACH